MNKYKEKLIKEKDKLNEILQLGKEVEKNNPNYPKWEQVYNLWKKGGYSQNIKKKISPVS